MTERDRGKKTEKNKKKENRNVDERRKKDKEGTRHERIEGEVRTLTH